MGSWEGGEDFLEKVIVLDFGGQYNQLVARRVRECKVYCELIPYYTPLAEILAQEPKGVIFTGSHASVYAGNAPQVDPALYTLDIPVLGICYGMQILVHALGGKVGLASRREYGPATLEVRAPDELFQGLPPVQPCWMSHSDEVLALPPGFQLLASTTEGHVAAVADPVRKLYGVQFHPEVRHTPYGKEILANFLFRVCGCAGDWTPASFITTAVAQIREEVGKKKVIAALSGGVDSTVAAALVSRAVGEQLTCIFVDHGLLRKNEAEEVKKNFSALFPRVVFVSAAERFLGRLRGVVDPEEKRKIIGEEFVRVFEEEAQKLGEVDYLVQGTLYPDVIESGTSTAATIKSHHNVGGLPQKMTLKLLEPLRHLFKDEVRLVGKALSLPADLVWRQPFPGPGLAVRILGEVTPEKLTLLREVDAVVQAEITKAGFARELWQFFAVLLPLKSVGVMGDRRTYAYPVVLRAVTSEDAMTADWARLPFEVLEKISTRIVNEVPGVNRVAYDLTPKPPATIEWE